MRVRGRTGILAVVCWLVADVLAVVECRYRDCVSLVIDGEEQAEVLEDAVEQ